MVYILELSRQMNTPSNTYHHITYRYKLGPRENLNCYIFQFIIRVRLKLLSHLNNMSFLYFIMITSYCFSHNKKEAFCKKSVITRPSFIDAPLCKHLSHRKFIYLRGHIYLIKIVHCFFFLEKQPQSLYIFG